MFSSFAWYSDQTQIMCVSAILHNANDLDIRT